MRSVTFSSSNDNPGASKTVEFKVNDGDVDSNLATKTLAITAVNDAPVVSVPGAQATDEDTALVFNAGNGNQISVGAAYDWPEASVFVLYTRLTNGASAQYNNTEATAVSPGADVNQIAAGISFRF